jgi:hypothetical protein
MMQICACAPEGHHGHLRPQNGLSGREKLAEQLCSNTRHHGKQVEALVGVDPSERLLAMPRRRAIEAGVHADMLLASATEILIESEAMDTVVMTWTLCSIADPLAALRELRPRFVAPLRSWYVWNRCLIHLVIAPTCPSISKLQHYPIARIL